jgi:hypothetical protein
VVSFLEQGRALAIALVTARLEQLGLFDQGKVKIRDCKKTMVERSPKETYGL